MQFRRHDGFSLIEVLIVITIISIVAVVGAGYYRGFFSDVELNTASKQIASNLKNARSKAMAGEDDYNWGVYFVNGTDDYYEIFSTTSTYSDSSATTTETIFLTGSIFFINPADGATTSIIFDKINGTTISSSISISSEIQSTTITVGTLGNIY